MSDDRFETKTAKEQGYNMPIGTIHGTELVKPFALSDITPEVEREVGKFREENAELPATVVVSKLISCILTSVGDQDFRVKKNGEERTPDELLMEVRKMYLADVYYMYLVARMRELGNDYVVPYVCPHCGIRDQSMKCDLSSMDVVSAVNVEALRHEVDLKVGLRYRDGSIKKKLFLSPIMWYMFEGPEVSEIGANEMLLKLFMLEKSITGVEGVKGAIMLNQEEFNTMKKLDREIASEQLGNMNAGPTLTVSGKCPGKVGGRPCEKPFEYPVNWDYDHFFSMSSLS